MRRLFIGALLILTLGAGAGWGVRAIHRHLLATRAFSGRKLKWAKSSSTSPVYVMAKDQWLEFGIPMGCPGFRLLSNASLPPGAIEESLLPGAFEHRKPYDIEVQVLDWTGKVMHSETHSYLSHVSVYQDPDSGTFRSSAFYLDNDWVPANGCEILIDFKALQHPRTLRARLVSADPSIHEVVLRTYTPRSLQDRRLDYEWNRLPEASKTLMASGNVYPYDLLRENEKRNLLQNLWEPVPPNSTWGHTPASHDLYTLLDQTASQAAEDFQPFGPFTDPAHTAFIPLPMNGGQIRLECTMIERMSAPSGKVRVTWVGRGPANRAESIHPLTATLTRLEASYEGGFLLVDADRKCFVRAFLKQSKGEREITPPVSWMPHYIVKPGQALEYELCGDGAEPTPLRLDLRQPLGNGRSKDLKASYAFLDQNGRVLKSGPLPLSREIGPWDNLPKFWDIPLISDTNSAFFRVPLGAARIRISVVTGSEAKDQKTFTALSRRSEASAANHPHLPTARGELNDEGLGLAKTWAQDQDLLLVAVFNRPANLVKEYHLPEDLYFFESQWGKTALPEWFPLMPVDSEELKRSQRWVMMQTQQRPEDPDEELLAGRFEWQELKPTSHWRGHQILAPWDNTLPAREESTTTSYRELHNGLETPIEFSALTGMNLLRPSLVRVGGHGPASFQIDLDGTLWRKGEFSGAAQEVILPPVTKGKHRVKVITEGGGRLYLNWIWPRQGDWTKHLGCKVSGDETLTFDYDRPKAIDEMLGVRFYGSAVQPGVCRIRISVQGPKPPVGSPLPYWSLPERLYTIKTGIGERWPVLDTKGETVDKGIVFGIRLGAELPAGRYKVVCRMEDASSGYIVLSSATPGLRTKALFHQEDTPTAASGNKGIQP